MDKLKVENFGPIEKADVTFGDLTFLVGAQASGKSLFLELLKLLVDKDAIVETLRKYNYIINKTMHLIYWMHSLVMVWLGCGEKIRKSILMVLMLRL